MPMNGANRQWWVMYGQRERKPGVLHSGSSANTSKVKVPRSHHRSRLVQCVHPVKLSVDTRRSPCHTRFRYILSAESSRGPVVTRLVSSVHICDVNRGHTSNFLNFAGKSCVLYGMWRSPMTKTRTIGGMEGVQSASPHLNCDHDHL